MLATPQIPRPQIEGAPREPAAMAESIPPADGRRNRGALRLR